MPTNFTEDKWMQAGEVRAGDRSHVHHIIVYVREPGRTVRPNVVTVRPIINAAATQPAAPALARVAAAAATAAQRPVAAAAQGAGRPPGGGDAMLVNWAVGEDAPIHLPGTAKRIPAGSTLIFQVHYTTNGKPGRDRSRIGLVFAKEPPQREIRTGLISNPLFAIPPGADNHQVEAEATFTEDVKIWSMHPHMHLRGKDMTYTATYPDGRSEIVLRVPEVRLRLADRLLARAAAVAAEGNEDPRQRPLRQLAREPRQPRSEGDRPLGRSDVGRDDDRLLHLYGGGTPGHELRE